MNTAEQPARYVLMTAACNEEAHIEETIASVLAQTLRPRKWCIVSDGSTDATDGIVQSYASVQPFIQLLRVTHPPNRSFSSKVLALHKAARVVEGEPYDFIGNLDADISLGPSYFEDLLRQFRENPALGIASGFIYEEVRGRFRARSSNRVDSVPHAAQLVRRACYQCIGGYAVLKYGGEDWYAQTSARMHGWEARCFPELHVLHHRHTGTAANLLRDRFRLGKLDYSFGSHPGFEILKCLLRVPERPFVLGGLQRLLGFASGYVLAEPRAVPHDLANFLRNEQRQRLYSLFSRPVREKRRLHV